MLLYRGPMPIMHLIKFSKNTTTELWKVELNLLYRMQQLVRNADTVDLEIYWIGTHNARTWTEIYADIVISQP